MCNYILAQWLQLFGYGRSMFFLKLYWPLVLFLTTIVSRPVYAAIPKLDVLAVSQFLGWTLPGVIILILWFIDTCLGFLRGLMLREVDEHRLQQGIGKLLLWFCALLMCFSIRLAGSSYSFIGISTGEWIASLVEVLIVVSELISVLRNLGQLSGNSLLLKWCNMLADSTQNTIDSKLNKITNNQEEMKQTLNEVVPLPSISQVEESKLLGPTN